MTATLPAALIAAALAAPPVTAVAYRPDGTLLAAGTRGEVALIDPAAGTVLGRAGGQAERVTALAFSPDGKRLAAASGPPGKAGEVRLYDLPAAGVPAAPARTLAAHRDAVYAMAFAPGGRTLATTGYDRTVKLWDADTGSLLHTLTDHSDAVYGLAFRPDGKLLATASADRAVKVWDAATGKRLYSLGDATDWLYAVAWSPDGTRLAAAGVDKSVRVWRADAAGGELVLSAFAHERPVLRLAFAADEKTLYSVGEDRVVKAWDAGRLAEKAVFPAQPDDVLAFGLRPDGKQVALGLFDGALVLADAATGKPQSRPLPEAPKPPKATKLEPAAGPAGVTVRVAVTGEHLAGVTGGTLAAPGAKVAVVPGGGDKAVSLELTLPAASAPGEVALTLVGPGGPSGPLTFTVDRFPVAAERAGNDAAAVAQAVPLPATVAGRVERAGDVDYYRVELAAGAELGVQLTKPVGSKLDPVLSITDAAGRVLAGGASVAGLKAPAAGAYTVGVRDAEYRGGGEFAYRLHLGPVPVVTAVFPLGLTRGTTADVRVEGVHLGGPRTVKVTAKADAAVGSKLPVAVPTPHGPALGEPAVTVGEFPAVTAGPVPVPGTADGRLDAPGRTAEWRFRAKKGEPLVVEVAARRLGSPLDPCVEILDSAGKPVPRATLRCVAKSATTFRDNDSQTPNIRLEAWNELAVNDLVYVGTELMRIRELPKNPDADCTFFSVEGQRQAFLDTTPTLHANGTPLYKVSVHPPGTSFPPNGMPVFALYYRNDDAGPGFGKDSRVTFDPPADGEYAARVGDGRGQGGPAFAYRLTVRPPRPDFSVRLSPASPKVSRGGAVPLTVTATRADGFEGPVELAFEDVPAGFRVPPTRLEEGELSTVVALACAADAPMPMKGAPPIKVVARAAVAGKDVVRTAAGGVPTPDKPGALVTAVSVPEVTIKPGGEAKLTVTIDRAGGHKGRVPLEVRGLPHGVRVIDVGLNGILVLPGQTRRTFVLRADPWVKPTAHPFVVLSKVEGKPGEFAAPSVLLRVAP